MNLRKIFILLLKNVCNEFTKNMSLLKNLCNEFTKNIYVVTISFMLSAIFRRQVDDQSFI